jgi:hypothetical protein
MRGMLMVVLISGTRYSSRSKTLQEYSNAMGVARVISWMITDEACKDILEKGRVEDVHWRHLDLDVSGIYPYITWVYTEAFIIRLIMRRLGIEPAPFH